MKIFKMIRGFSSKGVEVIKIMQNVIFHVKLLSPTLKEDLVYHDYSLFAEEFI